MSIFKADGAKLKIYAPIAESSPINGLAGAEVRCKFTPTPTPMSASCDKPTLRTALPVFRFPPL
jgi:hypothetical protein